VLIVLNERYKKMGYLQNVAFHTIAQRVYCMAFHHPTKKNHFSKKEN
jgi:hypothetical protein